MRTIIITVIGLLAGAAALAQGFLEEGVLNRKRTGVTSYPVYIISNLPERAVVPVMRGSLDVKRG
ncbi:MAG TPA: hypothetical protein PK794_11610, partial [Armatimonadota bacterium]|nr:hypothetical protein [Armatimonadota bacterium]